MIERVLWMIVAQAGGDGSASDGASSELAVQSVWDFVVKGGPMMVPIGLCSLVVAAVALERFISLRRTRVIPAGFEEEALGQIDRGGVLGAGEWCRGHGSPVARICAAGLSRLPLGIDAAERHAVEAGGREVQLLRRRLRALAVVASVAPLMGLLGTIFGMIRAFQTVALSGEALGRTELLARGIYEAMITTAAGLLVAIPALVLHHWLTARIESLVGDMDRVAVGVLQRGLERMHVPARAAARERTQNDAVLEVASVG